MDKLLGTLQSWGVEIVLTILGIVITRILHGLVVKIERKYSIDIDDKTEQIIMHIIRKGIRFTYQTFVKDCRETDTWTKTTKKEALNKCIDFVQNESRRMGLGDALLSRNLVSDIEGELVKVKNDSKKSETSAFVAIPDPTEKMSKLRGKTHV